MPRDETHIIETKPSEEVLHEIVQRIVQVAKPEKIILFGSAVRGEMGPHSDIDLLVIKSGVHRRNLAKAIYQHLFGVWTLDKVRFAPIYGGWTGTLPPYLG